MIVFLLLFVGIPLIELYFLIQVGSQIGALSTIGLSIFTALLGGALVRIQGFSVLMRVRDAVGQNQVPALELLDEAVLLVAGLVLLLPVFYRHPGFFNARAETASILDLALLPYPSR